MHQLQRRLDTAFDWRAADKAAKDLDWELFAALAQGWDAQGSECGQTLAAGGFGALSQPQQAQLACWADRPCNGQSCALLV